MSRRLTAGAAVGTTLVLTLAACGSSGKSADAGPNGMTLSANEVLLKTSQKTGQVDSFSADVTVSSSSQGTNGGVHATGQVQLHPDVAISGTLDKASFAGFTLNSSVPVVFLNDVLYAKVPAQLSQFSSFVGGKPWAKFDLRQTAARRGVDTVSAVRQVADFIDPGNLTKTFTASKDASKVGTETIDGVTTTHYKGTVTVKEALATLNAQTQQKLSGLYAEQGSKTANFELWADENGLARKVMVKADPSKGESTTLTVVYSDFGRSVKVSAPPAGDVGTLNLPGAGAGA